MSVRAVQVLLGEVAEESYYDQVMPHTHGMRAVLSGTLTYLLWLCAQLNMMYRLTELFVQLELLRQDQPFAQAPAPSLGRDGGAGAGSWLSRGLLTQCLSA